MELRTRLRGYLLVAAAGLFWGTGGVVVRAVFISRNADPVTLVQFRVTLSCLVLGAAIALLRPALLRVKWSDLPFFAVYGLGLSACHLTYYLAIQTTTVALAIFLQFLAPIATAVYEIAILRRKAGPATYAVLALALGGSLLLVLGQDGRVAASLAGIAFGLACALLLAFNTVYGQRGVANRNPWTVLFWATAVGTVLWTIVHPPWVVLAKPPTAEDWLLFSYLAVFANAIPFGLFLSGLRTIGPTSAIVTGSIEPVWASLLAFLTLAERMSWPQVLGSVLILSAIVALQAVPGAALGDAPAGQPARPSPPA